MLGAFLGVLSIRYRVDQIIGGTVINIFALGITSYLGARVLAEYPDLNQPGSFRPIGIPVLERLPLLGPLLFDNTIYVYLLFVLVFGLWWALFRTRWGLRVRAVGEHPRAADTVGINVLRTRYRSVILGGAVAGFGGTWFTLDATGSFNENMTAGKGFIALAALIFGRWHPVGAFGAALVFGFAEELQAAAGAARHADPVGVPADAPLPRHHRRGRRPGRPGPPAGRRRPALRDRVRRCRPRSSTGRRCGPPRPRPPSGPTRRTRTSRSAPPAWSTTAGWCWAATSRTRRTG